MFSRRGATLAVAIVFAVPAAAFAASVLTPPPGGPAPKALLGTWKVTLTKADQTKAALPAFMFSNWVLVVSNAKYLTYPRALSLRPPPHGGNAAPFGVKGNRIFIQCLGRAATVTPGYGTYTWSVTGKTLKFRRVSEPCKDLIRRNYIAILTSEPWKKAG